MWKSSYIINPAWYEDRQLEQAAVVADAYVTALLHAHGSGDPVQVAIAQRWGVLDGQALTCNLPRSGFEDKFHVKNWVTGNINVAVLLSLMRTTKTKN